MASPTAGQRAANLPWLAPAGPVLLSLADDHPDPVALAADPGGVLLFLRYSRPGFGPDEFSIDADSASQPILADAAARHLDDGSEGVLDTDHPFVRELLAWEPADDVPLARLAILGWLAVAAVNPAAAERAADAIRRGQDPAAAQTREWGCTADAITRRLCRNWRLPKWAGDILPHLHLPADAAERLGADAGLFREIQSAVAATDVFALTPQYRPGLRLPKVGPAPQKLVGLDLLPRLLRTAAKARRAAGSTALAAAEREADRLAAEVRTLHATFETRLRDEKLVALAELAAGAGHEINNPLAVISGNSRLLLGRETDPDRQRTLDSIVRQARRLADIVSDLMQFARPAAPATRSTPASEWLETVLADCRPQAVLKGIALTGTAEPVALFADPVQTSRAVAAAVRNGIDAAESGGWVNIEVRADSNVCVVVTDSGPGPGSDAIPHLFDPFFSGRAAGRGRGLGLSAAWRLTQNNGGCLSFEPTADTPARFVFTFPRADAGNGRMSA